MAYSGEEEKSILEKKGPVMVPVIADEPVGHGCLWRGGPDSRMAVNDSIGGVVAGVGDPVDPDSPIVTRNVREQPLNRVIGVRILVDVPRTRLDREIGSDIDELALRHVSAAHILKNKDKPVPGKPLVGTEHFGIRVRAIGRNIVSPHSPYRTLRLLVLIGLNYNK